MPFTGVSAMDCKKELVRLARAEATNLRALFRRFGVSPTLGYRTLRRYAAEGDAGLEARSRRPLTSPRRTSPEVEATVLSVRAEHPAWGGRWEGDALVVETDNLIEQVDQQYAHSAEAKIVERYRLIADAEGRKVLVNDWTLTDPVFYTEPVVAQKKWLLDPSTRILPYQCREQAWDAHVAELKAKAAGRTARR